MVNHQKQVQQETAYSAVVNDHIEASLERQGAPKMLIRIRTYMHTLHTHVH